MKKQIWKFTIDTTGLILMPIGSEILAVQSQHNNLCIWALVNPDVDNELREFELYGTGFDIVFNDNIKRKYIGTFKIDNETCILHVFEIFN